MSVNIRHKVILFFLVMSFVPFLLMTDLFPFMRFAMFAETLDHIPQRETFSIQVIQANGASRSLSERQIGLDDSHLNYLARTYYYNNDLDFFSSQIKKSGLLKEDERLAIIHKTLKGIRWRQDTLLVK